MASLDVSRNGMKPWIVSGCTALALLSGLPVAQASPPLAAEAVRPWMDTALTAEQRAERLEAAMTMDERMALVHGPYAWAFNGAAMPAGAIGSAGFVPGNQRLGIPALQESDASLGVTNPAGLRMSVNPERGATPLPSGLALAATFDPALAYKSGTIVGAEAFAKGFNVQLAGGVNLARDPRNGRNFEYLGEDPLLAGTMGGHSIRGIQDQHVISTIKHLSLNGQETGRLFANSIIEEKAHRESDLFAFEKAIEIGKPGSVMCAYNLVNGTYSCGNKHLLNEVLKRDWRYPGWVMSDWGAVKSTDFALAGLDQQSGEQLDDKVWFGAPLKQAIESGHIPQARLRDMVRRILRSMFAVGLFDHPAGTGTIDYAGHADMAREVAQNGIVLLKNDRDLLPLAKSARTIAVIGGHAEAGVLSGGGSSQVIEPGQKYTQVKIGGEGRTAPWRAMLFHASSPIAAIRAKAPTAKVIFDDGRYPSRAAKLAQRSDIAIVFANQWMSEGEDAPDLSLPEGQDAMIAAVAAANPRTLVVLQTGGAVAMPWLDHVGAVVEAWYSGARGGKAIANILFGDANPSGRLPVTFPQSIDQYPRVNTPGRGLPDGAIFDVPYTEGALVGYRNFAHTGQTPLFPFGYGLSYTGFRYSNLTIRGGQSIEIGLDVTNVGKVAGQDVPQAYLTDRGGTPLERLIGFEKLALAPGETRRITMRVDPRLLADFDVATNRWRVSGGTYQIMVGHSATNIALRGATVVKAETLAP